MVEALMKGYADAYFRDSYTTERMRLKKENTLEKYRQYVAQLRENAEIAIHETNGPLRPLTSRLSKVNRRFPDKIRRP